MKNCLTHNIYPTTKNEIEKRKTMHTYNVTFVMSPQVETTFLAWLHGEQALSNLRSDSTVAALRLQKVVEVSGKIPGPDHGLSIALQADFESKEAADKWGEDALPTLLGEFMAKFGPSAAYFTTLLETTTFH